MFFQTVESLVAADTDTQQDVYERSGGTTTLLSTGPTGGNGEPAASFGGSSADGSRVFFITDESLVAADTDTGQDVYERSGGTTTIHSIGPFGRQRRCARKLRRRLRHRVARVHRDPGAAEHATDQDGSTDVYESSGGDRHPAHAGRGSHSA